MLKPQKKKINKKDLKKDPLLDGLLKGQTLYEENKNSILYTVVGVLAVALIFIWVSSMMENREMEASSLLGKAQIEFDQFNFSKSRDFLNVLKEGYSGTDAAEQGIFLLANLNFNEQHFEEAKMQFKEFAGSYSGNQLLVSSAYAGIAACLETEKDYTGAAENYEKASSKAGKLVQASEYIYLAGFNYEKAGNGQMAQTMFQKVIDEFPDSQRKYDAQTKLILIASK
ncbi:MAG: hypothetical protein D8M58_02245 [Calditrichaeota bacterium]|nr:MAG: hypothetical protein DWQ03_04835 [Calditrichota bacterium]MBL1204185.1 hypothetical protein [Calditrichota bacterium]NOG44015.1 tetratricopeptide repeat protein [Calditrichota bacterium]